PHEHLLGTGLGGGHVLDDEGAVEGVDDGGLHGVVLPGGSWHVPTASRAPGRVPSARGPRGCAGFSAARARAFRSAAPAQPHPFGQITARPSSRPSRIAAYASGARSS